MPHVCGIWHLDKNIRDVVIVGHRGVDDNSVNEDVTTDIAWKFSISELFEQVSDGKYEEIEEKGRFENLITFLRMSWEICDCVMLLINL